MRPTPSLPSSDSRELAVNDSIILPSSVSRRHLLAGGAALGAAGKLSLLSAAILGASQAHAATKTYVTVSFTTREQYYIGSTLYEYNIATATDSYGRVHKWILTRRSNITGEPYHGIAYMVAESDAIWFSHLTLSNGNKTFTYTLKEQDLYVGDWPDTGTRRRATEIAWNLPAGSSQLAYYDVPPADTNEEIINAVSYYWGGRYYLRYTFRTHGASWVSRPITEVTGADRTAIINLINDVKSKAFALRTSKGVGIATAAITAGGIVAGVVSQTIVAKANIPIWVMAAGITTLMIGGVAVVATSCTAMTALSIATANLVVKCEELFTLVV